MPWQDFPTSDDLLSAAEREAREHLPPKLVEAAKKMERERDALGLAYIAATSILLSLLQKQQSSTPLSLEQALDVIGAALQIIAPAATFHTTEKARQLILSQYPDETEALRALRVVRLCLRASKVELHQNMHHAETLASELLDD